MTGRALGLFVIPLVCGIATAAAQQPAMVNLGFEESAVRGGRAVPAGWASGGEGFEVGLDSSTRVEGRWSLVSRRTAREAWGPGAGFGVASQFPRVGAAAGRAVRLSGWIRTEGVTTGYAGLWARADGPGNRVLSFDNMGTRGVSGTTAWARYEITIPVDSAATGLALGVLHPGDGTAWFDSLRLEVVGPPRPRQPLPPGVPSFEPPPRPDEPKSRLLTDDELRIPAADVDSHEAAQVMDWVRTAAHPIRSLSATTFDDLRFLAPLLRGKRILQLGESGHGVREFNLAKVRLIQYLHEELGYDVLAFESSLYECDRAGRLADSLDAVALMRSCIFGVWHTQELIPLFEYVKRTRATKRPLLLTGFDVQVSTPRVDRHRPAFLRRVVGALDTAYARRVFAVDSTVSSDPSGLRRPWVAMRDSFATFYDSLALWLAARERLLAPRFADEPWAPMLARQTARSVGQFLRQLATSGEERTAIRDRGMADNVDFLLDELYPGKKVMAWAHNSHIQHGGWGDRVSPDSTLRPRTMGTHVAQRRRAEVYTVGLYMYQGSAATNDRLLYPIQPALGGSLEAIVRQAGWRYAFLDLSRIRREPGSEWAFTPVGARAWGRYAQRIVPREEYDAILFVDRSWPPVYLYRR